MTDQVLKAKDSGGTPRDLAQQQGSTGNWGLATVSEVINFPVEYPLNSAQVEELRDISDRAGRVLGEVSVSGDVSLSTATLEALETVSIANFPASTTLSGPVALDSTTLAALETISVSNFPAEYDIADRVGRLLGHVQVDNFPSEYPLPSAQITDLKDISDRAGRLLGEVSVDGDINLSQATLDALEVVSVANFPTTYTLSGPIALDQTTLDALEVISVSSFPATYDIADRAGRLLGHVQVDNFPTSITINNGVGNPVPIALRDEAGTPFSTANPLPVTIDNFNFNVDQLTVTFPDSVLSTLNTTTTPLGANEVFIGQWEDILNYASISAIIFTDAASATNGAVVQYSADGITVLKSAAATIPANTGLSFIFPPEAAYFRIIYTNGPVAQTVLLAQVILHYQTLVAPVTPLGSLTLDTSLAQSTASHLKVRHSTGAWQPISATDAGHLNVAVPGGVEISNDTGNPIPVSVSSVPLPTGAATEATLDARTGALDETAPASDTAAAGINGRLQRLAQNITTLIGKLPGSLGQKARNLSLAVTLSEEDIVALAPLSSVSVDNFPANTEISNDAGNPVPVSGTVSVGNFPASTEIANDVGNPVPVSGTVAISNSSLEIVNDVGNPVPVSGTVSVGPLGVLGGVTGTGSSTVNVPSGARLTGLTVVATTTGVSVQCPWISNTAIVVPTNSAFIDDCERGPIVGPYAIQIISSASFVVTWVTP